MSPGEEEEGGAATAVAEETPKPDEAAGLESEQEPVEADTESGAEAEDEAAGLDEEVLESLKALKDAAPELFKAAVGEPEAPVAERERALDAREARTSAREQRTGRASATRTAQMAAQFYQGESLQKQVFAALTPYYQAVKQALTDATADEPGGTPRTVDTKEVVAAVYQLAQRAADAHVRAPTQAVWDRGLTAFEDSEFYTLLSTEERGKVEMLGARPIDEAMEGLIKVGIALGLRAAPDDFKTKTRKDMEEELGSEAVKQATLDKIAESGILSAGNGQKAKRGGAGRPRQSEDEILMDPETDIEEIKKIVARRQG